MKIYEQVYSFKMYQSKEPDNSRLEWKAQSEQFGIEQNINVNTPEKSQLFSIL